jgi:hypothetical protein
VQEATIENSDYAEYASENLHPEGKSPESKRQVGRGLKNVND